MNPSKQDVRKREDLDELNRVVSDTLDEYLGRIHGIFTSWAHPVEFLEWLRERGHAVVPIEKEEEEK